MMNTPTTPKGTLLVIDDIPDNIKILLGFLGNAGFKVLAAKDGEQGLKLAEHTRPDVILLDIMMPGIDGFEVCRRLKANDHTKEMPVIFMTALTDVFDKIKGFQVGAADYITKPVQQEEVLARVTVHLNLRKLQKQLEAQNRQLLYEISLRKEVEDALQHTNNVLAERTEELQAQALHLEQRNLELDAFAHTVAHDLKNPLSGIIGVTEIMKEASVQPANPLTSWTRQIHLLELASRQILNIIDAILLLTGVSRQTQVEVEPLDMSLLLAEVLELQSFMIEEYHGNLKLPKQWPLVKGYAPWVKEVWINYLSNGLKYGGIPPALEFGADEIFPAQEFIRFWVRDNGPGLSEQMQAQLFTPFTRLQKRVEGHGLGLSIVKHIIEKLGGQVGVESVPGQGSLFYFTLPAVH